ncbi:MAG TPA: cell division protein FtsQ/DivIB [Burkholderiales bacterium]
MWDNTRLINAVANALFALALALIAYAAARVLFESPALPLRSIRVQGELLHVTRAELVNVLQDRVRGTFFSVDLEAVRELFESVPWVRRAEVRRFWPDRLEVRLEEHVALAYWGRDKDTRLVNTYGELFAGRSDTPLPLFSGPAGTEGEVARRYSAFRQVVAPLGLDLREISLNARYAWQLKLSNGLVVRLGRESERDAIADRLARFVTVYPRTLGKFPRGPDYVDLRYSNGFALRIPEGTHSNTHRDVPSRT